MRIVGILCWADEKPLWLSAAVTAIAPLLDHLVALDGKYALYPNALTQPSSSLEQSMAVLEAASACNLGLTLYRPNTPFMQNEVEKRQLSISLAEPITEEGDWYLVFDGDMVARRFQADYIRRDLEASEDIVAEYARYENPDDEGFTPVRGMYRAIRGLTYGPAHYTISIPLDNGERGWLWGNPTFFQPYSVAYDLTSALKFDHRNTRRDQSRIDKAASYYEKRDYLEIERLGDTYVQDLNGDWVNARDRAWHGN